VTGPFVSPAFLNPVTTSLVTNHVRKIAVASSDSAQRVARATVRVVLAPARSALGIKEFVISGVPHDRKCGVFARRLPP